ncbi:unnamed protein product [Effrenium voratum]|nr:unnamed protein product [Effrenium voratum]
MRTLLQRPQRWRRLFSAAPNVQSSTAPWVVRASDPAYQDLAASSIEKHGFVIVQELYNEQELKEVTSPATKRAEEVLGEVEGKRARLGVGSRAGFQEVCLRSPGRYDVPCDFASFPDPLLQKLSGIASKSLGAAKHAFAGLVRAEPKSAAQIWHADSPHASAEHKAPHLLNVLVPNGNVTDEMGPTELVPGSHLLTNHLSDSAGFGTELLYQAEGNSPERIGSEEKPVAAAMEAGSVLIFDDRVLHRGGHNRAACNRDVTFFSYRQEGFMPSTHYESVRSLATYNHSCMAEAVRGEFPGLRGGEAILADGASGSQLHQSVIDAMVEQLRYGIANIGGSYDSSRRAEAAVSSARSAMADFLTCSEQEIAFGPSMTALAYHLARSFRNGQVLQPGDNVVLDPISHGANVWTWVQLAKSAGAEVRWLPVGPHCALDTERLAAVIDHRTRLVAMGAASNAVGTVHDITSICHASRELSGERAWTFVDAVHFAPHGHLNVQSIGCDFLACSPYKFFGPHSGVLYGRSEKLQSLPADRLDCSDNSLPSAENCNMSRWELGTQNYEALAGVAAAVEYLAAVGDRFGGAVPGSSRTERLETGFRAITAHENELKQRFLVGLAVGLKQTLGRYTHFN